MAPAVLMVIAIGPQVLPEILDLKVWLLVCGWYPEDKLMETLSNWKKAHHTWKINWGPRQETMSSGSQKFRNTCWNRYSVVSRAVGNPYSRMSLQDL